MRETNAQAIRTPFFGRYILETTGNIWNKETAEAKKKREKKLKEIFEIVDDYVEQA